MVIFINGSINSGKSTIAKGLSDKLSNTAVLEIDELRNFIQWKPLEESIPINLENACLLIRNFVKHNINVIVPYPVSQKNYDFFIKHLGDLDIDLYFVTLNPSLDVVTRNRGARKLSEWEVKRIRYHYQIGINNPSFGLTIDNSYEKPEETVEKIIKEVNGLKKK